MVIVKFDAYASSEIKFVPSYAVVIFHIAKQYFISKIFHSFRKERISLKKTLSFDKVFFLAVTNNLDADLLGLSVIIFYNNPRFG